MKAISIAALALLSQFYTPSAGKNAPPPATVREEKLDDRTGETKYIEVTKPVVHDTQGNAQGNQYDLAVDGAFEGKTVLVVHLYNFDLGPVRAALKEKG